jgi:hypothetical protein
MLARLAVLPLTLNRYQFGGQLGEAGIFDIQLLVCSNDSVLALKVGQRALLCLQIRSQGS